MKNISIIILATIFAFSSCKKDKFPEIVDLKGSWIEITNNSFKNRIIFEDETMIFFKSSQMDTLSYRLDDKQELIFLRLKNNLAAGESSHRILLNKKSKVLTIWGLFINVNTSETIFKFE
jgi:hypothetical protein